MTQVERTGWRDKEISERHRIWGDDLACTDLDWIVIEYRYSTNYAIIDYKHGNRYGIDFTQSSPIQAQIRHCDEAGKPHFIVFYWPYSWRFIITPMNEKARTIIVEYGMNTEDVLSELEYVSFLYRLRGLDVPESVSKSLKK